MRKWLSFLKKIEEAHYFTKAFLGTIPEEKNPNVRIQESETLSENLLFQVKSPNI
jgi:hypothetical protein